MTLSASEQSTRRSNRKEDEYSIDEKAVRVTGGTTDSNGNIVDYSLASDEALTLLRQILALANGMQSGGVVDSNGKQIMIAQNPTAANLTATVSIAAAQTLATLTSLSNLNATVPSSNLAAELANIAYGNLSNNILFNP